MKESPLIRFLYKTILGRIILKALVCPAFSKLCGYILSSSFSKWIVPIYIKTNHINMKYFNVPDNGFCSFNDFFTRKLKEQYNTLSDAAFVSPCDGLLTIKEIDDDSCFFIKHCQYQLSDLLQNEELASVMHNGSALIFRLTPSHYHRYVYCTDGVIIDHKKIPGILHCVRPVAVEDKKVYINNSREYTAIQSKLFGTVIQMEIGALLVGKISNDKNCRPLRSAVKGDEKGCFEFGGSTVIVLTENRLVINEDILGRGDPSDELPVIVGEAII